MFKVMFWARRKDDQSAEEFRRYWIEVHAPLAAKKLQGLRRYEINIVEGGPAREGFPDGVAELCFDTQDAFGAALATPDGKTVLDDIPNFAGQAGPVFVAENKIV